MKDLINNLLIDSRYASVFQMLGLYLATFVWLRLILQLRRASVYVRSWGWVATQILVMALMFYPIFYMGYKYYRKASALAYIVMGAMYVLSWIVNNSMNSYKSGLVPLTDKHFYFAETDHRLIHRSATVGTLIMLMLIRELTGK